MTTSYADFIKTIISASDFASITPETSKHKFVGIRYDDIKTTLNEYPNESIFLWLYGSHILKSVTNPDENIDAILPGQNLKTKSSYPDLTYISNTKVLKKLKTQINNILAKNDNGISRAKLVVKKGAKVEMKIGVKGKTIVTMSKEQYSTLHGYKWSDEDIYVLAAKYGVWGTEHRLPDLPKLQSVGYYEVLNELYGVSRHLFATPYDTYYTTASKLTLPSTGFGYTIWPPTPTGADIFTGGTEILREGGAFEANMIGLDVYHRLFINLIKDIMNEDISLTIFLLISSGNISYTEFEFTTRTITIDNDRELIILQSSLGVKDTVITNEHINTLISALTGKADIKVSITDDVHAETLKLPPLFDNKGRMTVPILTRFEKAKLIAVRAQKLAEGERPNIKVPEGMIDLTAIAEQEMRENKFPIKLVRPIPKKTPEIWEYSELYDPFL